MRVRNGNRLCKRARKQLSASDLGRAKQNLEAIKNEDDPAVLAHRFKLIGMTNLPGIYEAKAGGQNRFIFRLEEDAQGAVLELLNVGPHDATYAWANRELR